MLPLLLHSGLLKKTDESGDIFDVMPKIWDVFTQNVSGKSKLHFVMCRKLGQPRQHYVCLSKPTFSSVHK